MDRLDETKLENEFTKHGTEWKWKISPVDSPHSNGAAEAAVRTVKRALIHTGGNGIFIIEFENYAYKRLKSIQAEVTKF